MKTLTFRTIFVSDVHLGTRDSKTDYLLDFLQHTECENLYLLGDIFDLWKFRRGWYWPSINNQLIQLVLNKAKHGTRVVYIPGNHDEKLRDFHGMTVQGVEILPEFIHETADGRRLLLTHGDEFDSVVLTNWFTSLIGNIGYDAFLWLNRQYNGLRRRLGFPYWSLSTYLKTHVKNAMSHIERYGEACAHEAASRGYDGVVCGHIHHSDITEVGGVTYFNTGDWVENCTALTEDAEGRIRVVHWTTERHALLGQDNVLHPESGFTRKGPRRKAA